MARYQVGVIAIHEERELKVVLVTTRSGSRWIFPKGRTERGKRDAVVAAAEAFEEAGVLGDIDPAFQDFSMGDGRVETLRLYRMRVKEILETWPEFDQRDRAIVSLERAAKLLPKDLRPCLRWIS